MMDVINKWLLKIWIFIGKHYSNNYIYIITATDIQQTFSICGIQQYLV